MSYRCQMDECFAREHGLEPGPPRIVCDGCGIKVVVLDGRGRVPRWFVDGKAVPGWKTVRHQDYTRSDWCPECSGGKP